MGWGIAIVLMFGASLGLLIYLYQEHVDYLNKQIKGLKLELELTADCLNAHEEMVEDLEGYYEKWRETVDELNKAEQTIWEYKTNLAEAVKRIGEYEKELDMR